jgi:SAM-dependent methyltransferase
MPLVSIDTHDNKGAPASLAALPRPASREDASYLDFVEGLRSFILDDLELEAQVAEPLARARQQGQLVDGDIDSLRAVMDPLPVVQLRNRLMRSQQVMKWRRIERTMDVQREDLLAELADFDDRGPSRLELVEGFESPAYTNVRFHLQPHGYTGDALSGHHYHYGTKVFFCGDNNEDELHTTIVNRALPMPADGKVSTILDLACSIGQSTTALKDRFKDAEVTGIDHSSPMLRCAHRRAVMLGSDVTFRQALVENTGMPDASCDVVFAFILFHEIPLRVIRETLHEIRRILRPGGLFAMYDFVSASLMDDMQLYHRYFDSRHNGEAYGDDFCYCDFEALAADAGLKVAEGGSAMGHMQSRFFTR